MKLKLAVKETFDELKKSNIIVKREELADIAAFSVFKFITDYYE